MSLKTRILKYKIEGLQNLLFDRYLDTLEGEGPSQGAVNEWSPEMYYTTDEEKCLKRDEDGNFIFNFEKNAKDPKGVRPAIPVKLWLGHALKKVGKKVKLKGRQTIYDYIGSAFFIRENRVPMGEPIHLIEPSWLLTSYPTNKQGLRHKKTRPGYEVPWSMEFSIVTLDIVPEKKIAELIDLAGVMKGIGSWRTGDYGRFILK